MLFPLISFETLNKTMNVSFIMLELGIRYLFYYVVVVLFCLLHDGAVIWSSVYCRMWLMKVSNLVQANARKDSSFDLVHVSTLTVLDMPLLLQFPDREESPGNLTDGKHA